MIGKILGSRSQNALSQAKSERDALRFSSKQRHALESLSPSPTPPGDHFFRDGPVRWKSNVFNDAVSDDAYKLEKCTCVLMGYKASITRPFSKAVQKLFSAALW